MYLFGWVNEEKKETKGIKVPGGLSFLLHQDPKEPVRGLEYFPVDERPKQVNAVFQFYHIMVALGLFFIGLTVYSGILWWRGKLFWVCRRRTGPDGFDNLEEVCRNERRSEAGAAD